MALDIQCKIAFRWRPNSDSGNNSPLIFPKTTLAKQSFKFTFVTNQTCLSSLHHSSPPPPSNGTRPTSLLVEKYNYNEHQRLRDLLEKLSNTNSCPLQILTDYGDWTKDQFWAVVKFLIHASRSLEVLQVRSLSLSLTHTHTQTQKFSLLGVLRVIDFMYLIFGS